jgi:hypothetical protein
MLFVCCLRAALNELEILILAIGKEMIIRSNNIGYAIVHEKI